MPQVPYSPVGQASPSGQGLPTIHPDIPAAAFGGDVATAIQGMGKALQGAGNEIYERAKWLQDQNNQADARKASSDYTIEVGDLAAKYQSLDGKNARDAFPAYSEQLRTLRDKYKDGLSTTDSRKMFDTESMGTMSHAIMNGASHNVAQQKAYIRESLDSDVKSTFEQVSQNPQDKIAFDKGLEKVEQTIRQTGKLDGSEPNVIDAKVAAVQSKFWANKYENLAKEAPFQAQTEMYENRDKMQAADFKSVERLVNAQVHAVGSVNIAQDVLKAHTDKDGNLDASMSDLQAEVKAKADKLSPKDPEFQVQVVKTLDGLFNQTKYAKAQERRDAIQTINGTIRNGASTMQEILNDPQAYAAYKMLPEKDKNALPGQLAYAVKSRNAQDNEQMMTTLNGMRNNDVEKFLNINPNDPDLKLSQSQIRKVQDWQTTLKKNQAQDPRVDRAMRWMRESAGSQMAILLGGTLKHNEKNQEDYNHLTGMVQQALDLWQEDHGKPPSNKEFNEQIAPQILLTHHVPGWFGTGFGSSEDAYFKHDTSSKEYQDTVNSIKQDVIDKGGAVPTDEELYKAYSRIQLQKLYPAKKAEPK